ncbi:MAG: YciI family protein, partial [Armatimonadota bacterium]
MIGLLASTIAVILRPQVTPNMVTMQMVFLRVVPGRSPLTKNLSESYQQRHLAGLQKLWEDGKAIAVGPMEDESYAGLVLLNAKDADEAKSWLEDDPYVKSGLLSVDVLPW